MKNEQTAEQSKSEISPSMTLYHGSPANFSAIDSEKIGLGQNFVGRGFYTETSVVGVHYVMEEINHENYNVYALDIPANATILDRENSATLTNELRDRIREAGATVHQQMTERGETSRVDLGDRLADSKKIDETFMMFASTPQGMNVLKEAGVTALKDNSYVCIVDTDLVNNIRLHSAGGEKRAELNQYVERAIAEKDQASNRLGEILKDQPNLATHYDAIKSKIEHIAHENGKPEEAEKLKSLLTYSMVETVDKQPDRTTNIAPLNRVYGEAVQSLNLDKSPQGLEQAKSLGKMIDEAVISVYPSQLDKEKTAEHAVSKVLEPVQEKVDYSALEVTKNEQDKIARANEKIEIVHNQSGPVHQYFAYDRSLGGSAKHPQSVVGFWKDTEITRDEALKQAYEVLVQDREHLERKAREALGKPDASITEAQQGEKYTGKVLYVNDRHIAQVNDKTAQIVLHDKTTLSGMQRVQENRAVEIAYPAGRAGIVRDPQTHQHGKSHEAGHEHGRDSGERER